MAPSSVKTFGVKEAIAELCTAAADFQQKASSTVVLKSEFAKVGQVVKKLGLLQEDWQNTCEGRQIAADAVEVAAIQVHCWGSLFKTSDFKTYF